MRLFSKLLYFPPQKNGPAFLDEISFSRQNYNSRIFFLAARRRAAGSWARWWATSTAGCATARPTRARANGSPTCGAGGSTGPSCAHPGSSQTPGVQTTAPSELRASEVRHIQYLVTGRKEQNEKSSLSSAPCAAVYFSHHSLPFLTKGEKKLILGGGFGRGVNCSQMHIPFLGDKVDYSIGLSFPARQPMWPDGPVRKLYAIVNFIPPVMDFELGLCLLLYQLMERQRLPFLWLFSLSTYFLL